MDGHERPIVQKINAGQATVQPIESEDEKIKKVLLAKDNALLNGKSKFALFEQLQKSEGACKLSNNNSGT